MFATSPTETFTTIQHLCDQVLHHDHKEITAVNKQSKVESDGKGLIRGLSANSPNIVIKNLNTIPMVLTQ